MTPSWSVELLAEDQERFCPRRWFTSFTKYSGIGFTVDPKHAKTFDTPEAADEALDDVPGDKRRTLSITRAPNLVARA